MSHDRGVSRRHAIWVLGASAGVAVIGCTSGRRDRRTPEQQVENVSDTVERLMNDEPTLPGIVSAQAIASAAFSGRSDSEARLLAGRLYYDAVETLSTRATAEDNATSRYSPTNVRRALAQPVPVDRFERGYFDGLLSDTQARMHNDAVFARRIDGYSSNATSRINCKCTINGEDAACWKCLIIIVIIIIILV